MPEQRSIEAPLRDPGGRVVGRVTIALLPEESERRQLPSPLVWDDSDPAQASLQVVEGREYRYTIHLDSPASVAGGALDIDRPEVFSRDSAAGDHGRLRPGLYVGTIRANVSRDKQPVGSFAIEVRSRKLTYLSQYRWMLRDLTEVFAEVLMQRFAPAEQRFASDGGRDAATLYQRFAFLQQLLTSERFVAAVTRIISDPHRAWVTEEELRSPSQGFPASSRTLRQITAPGPRVALPRPLGRLAHLPRQLVVERTEETLDTAENRFVKYAFGEWYGLLLTLRESVSRLDRGATQLRGLAEIDAVLASLGQWLAADLFREVGRLQYFPAASQVLQKREGYREILQAYLQVETAAKLSWAGGDDVYGAGQRDVATLYEYWVYLQLAAIISRCCSVPLDTRRLFDVTEEGLSVGLKRGQNRVLTGSVECLGRRLELDFWYNRTFSAGPGNGRSWTVQMRPDYSLRIQAEGAPDEVWVHFDAKYRIDDITGVFGSATDVVGQEDEVITAMPESGTTAARAKRDDLLKMHAYRDAIRRSAGAYVVYPGTENRPMKQYHELLPGLGAFHLRPTDTGDAVGTESIATFVRDVIKQVATQASQHERSRYWQQTIHADAPAGVAERAALFLTKPPADTVVLLGYVKSEAHYEWIRRTRRYNMRADDRPGRVSVGSRELAAEFVVLYGPDLPGAEVWAVNGNPEVLGREWLDGTGYPAASGSLYLCLPLPSDDSAEPLLRLDSSAIAELRAGMTGLLHGQPVAVTWAQVSRGGPVG